MSVEPVSQELAEQVREVVIAHFPAYTQDLNGVRHEARDLPVLHEPDTGWGEHWVLSWEGTPVGTPYEWPILVTGGGYEEYTGAQVAPAVFPAEVFCEPINGIELGIYPAG